MKETVITAGRKKLELWILIGCMVIAYILNVVGIIIYSTSAKELVTQLPLVLLVGVILYILSGLLRALFYLLFKSWRK